MKNINKNITMLFILILLASCRSNSQLNTIIVQSSPAEFIRALERLKITLNNKDYMQLTNAIGYLKIVDTKHMSVKSFFDSLNGLSPKQIIDKSKSFKTHAIY